MVFEHQDEYPSQWKAIQSISEKLKVDHESLRQGAAAAAPDLESAPAAATGVLERRARLVDGALGATAFVAVIGAAAGAVSYCNAGQVPPILVGPDRSIVELEGARSPLPAP